MKKSMYASEQEKLRFRSSGRLDARIGRWRRAVEIERVVRQNWVRWWRRLVTPPVQPLQLPPPPTGGGGEGTAYCPTPAKAGVGRSSKPGEQGRSAMVAVGTHRMRSPWAEGKVVEEEEERSRAVAGEERGGEGRGYRKRSTLSRKRPPVSGWLSPALS
ncbi:hypothetical protein HPP92_010431 [Vanilla planifolia]|uniref:Uncharacterized protein n=1 Tax=Vanilla planifolia TaxID=51239 RepID=A0A835V1T8_VANPL|nr:hypothetical protein HPP92_010431 [Vanilla planifolia]